jgi:hypothetical protein
MNTQF